MTWITENLSSIIVFLILLVVVGTALYSMINKKRKGGSSCGCNCGSCAMSGMCEKNEGRK